MKEFKGSTILVTGSTKGIGNSIANLLADEGAKIIYNGRDPFDLNDNSDHLFFKGDLSQKSECIRLNDFMNDHQVNLSGLVCNIGSGSSVAPGNESREEWGRVFDTNFFSCTGVIESLKDRIIENKTPIVITSSICGLEILGAPLTYSVAKSAVNMYTVGLAKAWGKYGVRINAVAPGNILFNGSVWERKLAENKKAVEEMLSRDVALQRLGKPEEISEVVKFLLSSKSSFVTGSILVADGGQVRGV